MQATFESCHHLPNSLFSFGKFTLMVLKFQSMAFEVVHHCLASIVNLSDGHGSRESVSRLAEGAKVMLLAAQGSLSGTAIPATLEHCKATCGELIAICEAPNIRKTLVPLKKSCENCIKAI